MVGTPVEALPIVCSIISIIFIRSTTLVHAGTPDCLDDEAEDGNENAGHGPGAGQEGQAPRGGTAGRPAAVAEVESAGATSSQLTPVVKYALCARPQTAQKTYHDTGMMSRSSFERSAL